MNTVVENWVSHEDIMEEPGNGCRVCDQIAEGHSTSSSNIFSIVNSAMFHLRSQASGFVSDIFRHFQTDSDGTAWSEEDKTEVCERLKREIERVNMKSHPFLSEM